MGFQAWLRGSIAFAAIGLMTVTALAADISKGQASGKDKANDKNLGNPSFTERSTTRSTTSDPPKTPSALRTTPVNPGVPASNGGGSAPNNSQGMQSQQFSQAQAANRNGANFGSWRNPSDRDQWERNQWERDRWEREQEERDRWNARNDRLLNANFNNFNANRFVSGTGTFVGATQGLLQVSADGVVYQVRPEGGAKIEITGTAGPDFLKPGLVIKFQAALDPNGAVKNKAINPINSLEIITPRIGETLGAVPTGADAAANAKANPPVPATARTLAIIGRIVSYAKGELSVSADGRVFKADLDPAPVIKVRVSDFRYARAGDEVDLTGYFVRPGLFVANRVGVKLANPLGDPLADFVKQKPAAKLAPPAAVQR